MKRVLYINVEMRQMHTAAMLCSFYFNSNQENC